MIKHLACIMDGNRRWARKKGWMPWIGHKEGLKSVLEVVNFCLEKKIPYLSLYTFSLENLDRSEREKDYLFTIVAQEAESKLDELIEKKVHVQFIGDRMLFPNNVLEKAEKVERQTAHLEDLTLNLLFCYGARQEIISAIKRMVRNIKAGLLFEDDISEKTFMRYLWTNGIPEPDLIIRTGGVKRLSNFLLYQAAYSELYFLDCLWPEITKKELEEVVSYFEKCKRNFGR